MLNTIEDAIKDLKAGKMIIVVDDENRENEGDFIMPAQTVTKEHVNFMLTFGKGLICAPVSYEIAKRLELELMLENPMDSHKTAFTVSVDFAHNTTTGISATERALTLKSLADKKTSASDFLRPGHIFPLIAKDGGVIERPGHTEAAVDLAFLAGFEKAGVICEILKADGECARLPELKAMAQNLDLKIITIESLINHLKEVSNE